jgi:hypothetical protein
MVGGCRSGRGVEMTTVEIAGPYGPHVKVVCKPAAPPSCDLVVMVWLDGKWREAGRFNDMSNDTAYTDADHCAKHQRQRILEGETRGRF